jgi:hypothetical protein
MMVGENRNLDLARKLTLVVTNHISSFKLKSETSITFMSKWVHYEGPKCFHSWKHILCLGARSREMHFLEDQDTI